jgi:hypothetical protein
MGSSQLPVGKKTFFTLKDDEIMNKLLLTLPFKKNHLFWIT